MSATCSTTNAHCTIMRATRRFAVPEQDAPPMLYRPAAQAAYITQRTFGKR